MKMLIFRLCGLAIVVLVISFWVDFFQYKLTFTEFCMLGGFTIIFPAFLPMIEHMVEDSEHAGSIFVGTIKLAYQQNKERDGY